MDNGTFKSDLGLLGLLGYRVGDHGRSFAERTKILDRVWKLPIYPDVKEKVVNWEEWGDPESPTRYRKLIATLSTFVNRPGMAQATSDWQRDLEYVRNAFCKDEKGGEYGL